MDVSQELKDYAAKHTTAVLDRPNPVEVDAGLLVAFDNTPVDHDLYSSDIPGHLLSLTLTSTHSLISTLFNLPTHPSSDGPIATLPPPTTLLPREKPLPTPKPLTKWERFAKEKGISHRKKDRQEWDEERQEWVKRWGRDAKNKDKEDQWLHEVKAGDDADHDPGSTAKKERKARIAKNTAQHAKNLALAQSSSSSTPASSSREKRKGELQRSLLISKSSTASLGRFDRPIEGEPRAKGVKRKFESNDIDFKGEKEKALGVLKRVESGTDAGGKRKKEEGVNVRKAVRHLGREERKGKAKGRK